MSTCNPLAHLCVTLSLFFLSACSQQEPSADLYKEPSAGVHKEPSNSELNLVLNPRTALWQAHPIHSPLHFSAVLVELNRQLATPRPDLQQLDRLLYFLRAYSYFGPLQPVDDLQWLALDQVLQNLAAHPAFSARSEQAARLQEHFAVTLYRYYSHRSLAGQVAQHLPVLAAILQRYESGELSRAENYSLWESFRALGFLAYQAKSHAGIKSALLGNPQLCAALLAYARSDNNSIGEENWPLRHSLWALGNLHVLLDETAGAQLDEKVWALLSHDLPELTQAERRELFTLPYLVSSYRGKNACDKEFADRCAFPSERDALPIAHHCSASLIIRANRMSETELGNTCTQLLSLEDNFHRKLASEYKPVTNDHNSTLEVVVFDNYSQYNHYGQLLFDIHTDNGGKFLEGEPDKRDNQARFIAFEAFWQQSQFSIWNLEHEYVHYLDGRYNKYGALGHFPSHLVWWSEGLANYIALGDGYEDAVRELAGSRPSERPGLGEIFATTYDDGIARVYSWSYLAVCFLYQTDADSLSRLAQYLRADDFDGYRSTLQQLANDLQPQFAQWLAQQADSGPGKAEAERLPRQLYRYLYRDYLQPSELPLDDGHRHRG